MPTYRTVMTEKEYQTLRHISMRGGFTYEFSRDMKDEVEFKIRPAEVNDFFTELETSLPLGETTWREHFDSYKESQKTK